MPNALIFFNIRNNSSELLRAIESHPEAADFLAKRALSLIHVPTHLDSELRFHPIQAKLIIHELIKQPTRLNQIFKSMSDVISLFLPGGPLIDNDLIPLLLAAALTQPRLESTMWECRFSVRLVTPTAPFVSTWWINHVIASEKNFDKIIRNFSRLIDVLRLFKKYHYFLLKPVLTSSKRFNHLLRSDEDLQTFLSIVQINLPIKNALTLEEAKKIIDQLHIRRAAHLLAHARQKQHPLLSHLPIEILGKIAGYCGLFSALTTEEQQLLGSVYTEQVISAERSTCYS